MYLLDIIFTHCGNGAGTYLGGWGGGGGEGATVPLSSYLFKKLL